MSKKGYKQTEEHIKKKNNSKSLKLFYKDNPNTKCGFQKGNKIGEIGGRHKGCVAWNKGKTKKDSKGLLTMALSRMGKNNPLWKGGIQHLPYPVDWTETLKRAIRERDNYICQLCSQYGNNVHHIDQNKKNCNPDNLITLCKKCHCLQHNAKHV